jgi:hypothetical protein
LGFGFDRLRGGALVGSSAGSLVRKVAPAKDGEEGGDLGSWDGKRNSWTGGEIGIIGREGRVREGRGERREGCFGGEALKSSIPASARKILIRDS